jgi:hypothetical protein
VIDIFGGKLSDISPGSKRKFPGKEKRKVKVSIGTFDFIGGIHYYVDLEEEDNPFMCRCTDSFSPNRGLHEHRPHNDEEGRGKAFHNRFDTKTQAERWAVKKFKEEFSKKTHVLVEKYSEKKRQWMYKNNGD